MTNREIIAKLVNLLYKRTIYFDHKSYDDQEDIPYITIRGERRNVESVTITKNNGLIICCVGVTILYDKDEFIETEEVYNLLQNMYYETNESYDIGDFEQDFLGLAW